MSESAADKLQEMYSMNHIVPFQIFQDTEYGCPEAQMTTSHWDKATQLALVYEIQIGAPVVPRLGRVRTGEYLCAYRRLLEDDEFVLETEYDSGEIVYNGMFKSNTTNSKLHTKD